MPRSKETQEEQPEITILDPKLKGKILNIDGVILSVDGKGNLTVIKANNVFLEDVKYMCLAPSRTADCFETKPMKEKVEIGDEMPDGTVFLGISPDNAQGLFLMPKNFENQFSDVEATRIVSRQTAYGHSDWRLPTRRELECVYNNKRHKSISAVFNTRSPGPWYWVQIANNRVGGFDMRDKEYVTSYSSGTKVAVSAVRTGPVPIGYL